MKSIHCFTEDGMAVLTMNAGENEINGDLLSSLGQHLDRIENLAHAGAARRPRRMQVVSIRRETSPEMATTGCS